MIKVNEHGCLTLESADKTIKLGFYLYVTSITIGDFWIHFGRDCVWKDDWDEMFFFYLQYRGKEVVKIYAYLPEAINVSILEKNLCN